MGLALSANAATVKLGAEGGALVFEPAQLTVKAGETVEWVNNVGFPHNVVFDEDEIPVSPARLSMSLVVVESKLCTSVTLVMHLQISVPKKFAVAYTFHKVVTSHPSTQHW